MTATALLVLFIAHWIGDFPLQSSAMALNKSRSIKWLTFHVAIYSLVLFCFSLAIMRWPAVGWFVLANAGLHWITDFFTSKLALKFQDQPKIFYPIIGFDQLIHYSCLVFTWDQAMKYY